jgi:hypothetical protein
MGRTMHNGVNRSSDPSAQAAPAQPATPPPSERPAADLRAAVVRAIAEAWRGALDGRAAEPKE